MHILDFTFGAFEIRTLFKTGRFADSHSVAIALHATGCVSLYVNLSVTWYFFSGPACFYDVITT